MWNLEENNPALSKKSHEILLRLLPTSLDPEAIKMSILETLKQANEILSNYGIEESRLPKINLSDFASPFSKDVVFQAQMNLLRAGIMAEKKEGVSNPVILHCLVLEKIIKRLTSSR
jgi:hypothetical protein